MSGSQSSFFFPPVQRHLEWPDLLGYRRFEGFLVVLAFCPSCRENLSHRLLKAMLPMRTLRRMHSVRAGEFMDGFEPFERFQRHTGFERCAVLFPLCRHPSLLTS